MTTAAPTPAPESTLLPLLETLARELNPRRTDLRLSLDSSLEREIGLDSLGRVELLRRLEAAFGSGLAEQAVFTAETVRDLLPLLAAGGGGGPRWSGAAALLEEAEAAPDRTRTLLEALAWHVERHPGRRHIAFDPGDGGAVEEMSYADLERRSRQVAYGLRQAGLAPGQAVALMLPSGLDYFTAFFGAQMAGGVPVPLYPPARLSQVEDHLRRQAGILRTAQARVLISFAEVLPLARLLRPQAPDLQQVTTVGELAAVGQQVAPIGRAGLPPVHGDDLAFLQFTSGSTGDPKGVMLTHANLLANLRAIGRGAAIGPGDAVVSWLPLYHDMGLIGAWMGSLYFAMPLALMSPLTFLARPARWLWAVHHHRGTLSAAPNFAYELCLNKIDDAELEGLDLSSWRGALNGAEPVSPETITRFTERFSRYGFRSGTMMPVYGLAECSLAVAFPPPGREPVIDRVDREAFQKTGRALPAAADDPAALRNVSCGFTLPDHEVRIVDPAGRELGEREQGQIQFRGPSVTQGYFRNPEATERLVAGEWRNSGDLGYLAQGEVYVTGRAKDLIIRAGRNLYPQELEGAVGEIPGVRTGCVAVFGSADPQSGTERLVVLAETREREAAARERLREAIQQRTVDLLGSPADEVVLVPPQAVPKTSSGKLRRAASKEMYETGKLSVRSRSAAWQVLRLAAAGALPQLRRWGQAGVHWLYGIWFWLAVVLSLPLIYLGMLLLPGLEHRRRFARAMVRGVLRCVGQPPAVLGLERLPAGPCLVAANHASYVDGFYLTAVLPARFAFVVKQELEGPWVSRVLLRRLGTVFVERFQPGRGEVEAGKVLAALRAGQAVAIFPEGTFGRATGLLPFRMGGFRMAAEAGVPVVPVALRGTRDLLRGGQWLPRRSEVAVAVLPPVLPEGKEWAASVELRDAVRGAILAESGEPDLAERR